MSEPTIEDYYVEDRTFPPSDQFQASAIVTDRSLYEEAEADRLGFWARQARELITWFEDFETILEWDLPFAKWFALTDTLKPVEEGRLRFIGKANPATPEQSPIANFWKKSRNSRMFSKVWVSKKGIASAFTCP